MPDASRPLILASSSPRRRDLLRGEGFRFRITAPEVDESQQPGESAPDLARRLAVEKAAEVADRSPAAACILASDTVVSLGDQLLGKPRDVEDAVRMLLEIAGKTHTVFTGYAALVREKGELRVGVANSQVTLRPVSVAEAHRYAATGEPLDKAGAYALQGRGGRFVSAVVGSRSNVIGLPLEAVIPLILELGVERG